MKELYEKIAEQAKIILAEQGKDTKAGHKRIRSATIVIAKLGKEYRKLSIEADKA